jgi:hypothetical protein
MKRLLLATIALLALAAPASADIILENKLSGTGDNVVFNSLNGDLARALLNGQHQEIVDFRDLTGSTTFSAAANGNDIKVTGSNNLFIQVWDAAHANVVGTTTQVFSLNGTGHATAFVAANDANGNPEAIVAFDLGDLDLNKPSNFTFSAINGEVMTSLRILDLTGNITSFEHYRIDTFAAVPGPVAGVPDISTWTMMIIGFLFVSLFRYRKSREQGTQFRWFSASPTAA